MMAFITYPTIEHIRNMTSEEVTDAFKLILLLPLALIALVFLVALSPFYFAIYMWGRRANRV